MGAPVAVVGSYNQDFAWRVDRFNAPGETRLGRFRTGPGGKGSNQAIGCARLGAATRLVAALGRDALGEQAAALFAREGIDARIQHHADLATGSAAILIDAAGQNMIVVDPGANAGLSVAHVEAERAAIASARVLLTQQEVAPAATRRALELAGAAGTLRIHDPAPALPVGLAAPLADIDVLTPNEGEFAQLLAQHAGLALSADALHALPDAELHALCRRLPVPSLVLTLGARGVFASHAARAPGAGDGGFERVEARRVEVRDTTGAGDAFSAGLATALAEGRGFSEALRFAAAAGALQVQRPGAAGAMPTRAELDRVRT